MMAGEIRAVEKSCAVPFMLGGMVGAGMVLAIPLQLTKGKLSGHLLRYVIKRKIRRVKKDIEKFAATTGMQISWVIEQGTDTFAKSKSGLAGTAQKSRSLYEGNKEKIADYYQSVGDTIQKGKSLYEEQKKIAVLPALEKSMHIYDELRGRLKDIGQPIAVEVESSGSEEQKGAAGSTRSARAMILPVAAGTATGVALLLLSGKAGKDLGKDLFGKDILDIAVDAGKLILDFKTGRR